MSVRLAIVTLVFFVVRSRREHPFAVRQVQEGLSGGGGGSASGRGAAGQGEERRAGVDSRQGKPEVTPLSLLVLRF